MGAVMGGRVGAGVGLMEEEATFSRGPQMRCASKHVLRLSSHLLCCSWLLFNVNGGQQYAKTGFHSLAIPFGFFYPPA